MRILQAITFPIVILAGICAIMGFLSRDYAMVALAIAVMVGHLFCFAPMMVVTAVILCMGAIQLPLVADVNPLVETLFVAFAVAYLILASISVFHLCVRIFLNRRTKKTNLQKQ